MISLAAGSMDAPRQVKKSDSTTREVFILQLLLWVTTSELVPDGPP